MDRPPRRRRRWPALLAAAVLLLAGTFGGGTALGYSLALDAAPPATQTEVVRVEVPDYAAGVEAAMPDVRGLPADDAFGALVDAGIPREVVALRERPAAGPPGLVVEQTPAFGAERPDEVTLLVSAPAVVPDVRGTPEAAARTAIEELGARVAVTRAYSPGAAPSSVVRTEPAAGAALPEQVQVVVAEAPGAVFLDALDAVEGGCSTGETRVGGRTLPHSVRCGAGDDEPTEVAYLLGRAVDEVTGVVGVPDDGDDAVAVRVQALVDGRVVADATARYGTAVPLRFRSSGGLRLTLRISQAGRAPQECCTSAEAVLGDVELVGSATGVQGLVER